MKLSEYIEKYGDKQVDVSKMNELIVEDNKEWFPELGERYFYCDNYGSRTTDVYREDDMEISNLDRQKPCKTEEEADFEDAKKVFLRFMEVEFKNNSDEINWKDGEQVKYVLKWAYLFELIIIGSSYFTKCTPYNTTNKEWLEQFIKDYKNEIKMYYFEVKGEQ